MKRCDVAVSLELSILIIVNCHVTFHVNSQLLLPLKFLLKNRHRYGIKQTVNLPLQLDCCLYLLF